MKNKFLNLILAICLIIPSIFVLTACSLHECKIKEDWEFDETHHWHICEDSTCPNIFNKTEHCWDNGVVTTEATYLSSGVRTYTCIICDATKTEAFHYDKIITSEWYNALAFVGVTNMENIYEGEDGYKSIYQFANGVVYEKDMYDDGEIYEYYYVTEENTGYEYQRCSNEDWYKYDRGADDKWWLPSEWFHDFKFFNMSAFTFNTQTGKYEADYVQADWDDYEDVALGFENGKLVSVSYAFAYDGYKATQTFTYGNVEMQDPTKFECHDMGALRKALAFDGDVDMKYVYQEDGYSEQYIYNDGVVYYTFEDEESAEDGVEEYIYTYEDGEYYVYSRLVGEDYWLRTIGSQDDYNSMYEAIEHLSEYQYFNMFDFIYNKETEKYEAEIVWLNVDKYNNVQIEYKDGKVLSISYELNSYTYSETFNYNAEVSIPTAEEWH